MTHNVRRRSAAILTILSSALLFQFASFAPVGAQNPTAGAAPESALLTLGGVVILRLCGTVGGADPEDRVDAITDRLTPVLAQPDLKPSDVVVLAPPKATPVIYVLGRSLVTVDKVSAAQSGIGNQLQTAIVWAHKLQQVLPLVDIRLRNESEPVIPANPPLLVTTKLADVGGATGEVDWNGHLIISLMASPVAGVTAAQYCDAITTRLGMSLYGVASRPIIVTTQPSATSPATTVDLLVNGSRLISATTTEAKAAGITSPQVLAEIWSGNLQRAIATWLTVLHTVPPST